MQEVTRRVAVIVPVYNVSEYLEECISSIRKQTFRDLTLYLVDDGSTDHSGDICDRAAGEDERIVVIHKENEGLAATWMRGVRESREPYLFFVDGDDYIEPDSLERLMEPLKESSADQSLRTGERTVICGGGIIERMWNHTSEREGNAAPAGEYTDEKLRDLKARLLGNERRQILPSRCMKIFSRKLIKDNMHYSDPRIRMGEDLNITTPVLLDADRIVLLPDAFIYHYRFVTDSMVHKYDAGMYENILRLCRILHGVMADKKVANGHMQVDREFLYLYLIEMKNELRCRDMMPGAVRARIRSLCLMQKTPDLVRKCGVTYTGVVNRLLIWMLKNPTDLRIRFLQILFARK